MGSTRTRFFNLSFMCLLVALLGGSLLSSAELLPKTDPLKDKDKEEKPKEAEFKYSAWCAFRDLSSIRPPPAKVDPKDEQSRPGSQQWEGFGRRGQWTTLVLDMKNTTEDTDFKGTAAVNLNPLKMNEEGLVPYTSFYRQEFMVPRGGDRQIFFSVLCPENGWNEAVSIDIVANGRSYPQRLITLHDLDAGKEDFIVVVSEKSGAFRHLATKRRNIEDDSRLKERRVAVVEPKELPKRWHDLMLANLIILDNPPPPEKQDLTAEHWDALKSYVQAGGHVLIIAGNNPARIRGPAADLVGMTVKEMTEVDGLDGGESNDVNLALKAGTKLPLVEVSVNPGGTVAVQRNHKTQLVEKCTRAYGPGTVTFLPYSLSDPLLENWEGRNVIPIGIVERARERSLFSQRVNEEDLPPARQRDAWGNWIQQTPDKSSLREFRHTLDESFSHDTPVKPQTRSDVMSFLLFYLLFAVPGNYFIFGWFRRREVAWLAVPMWAASFSMVAYLIGYYGQTGQLTASEVSVIEAGSGQNSGMARTFLGLYAPRRDDYQVEFRQVAEPPLFEPQAAPGHLLNPQTRNIDIPELRIVEGGRVYVERLRVQQRSTRQMEVMHRAQVGEGLDVKVRRDENNALSIDIENLTGFTLYSPVLLYEGQAIELGMTTDNILDPKGKNSIPVVMKGDLRRKDMNLAFFGKSIVIPSALGKAANERKKALGDYLRTQIERYSRSVVVAWLDNPEGCLPVMVAGSGGKPARPRVEGLTMLVVPVSIKSSLSSASPVAGRAKLKVSSDFNIATNHGNWKDLPASGANANVQLTAEKNTGQNANNPVTSVAYLTVQLPARYRELADEGLQLKLQFKLEAAEPGGRAPGAPGLDGNLEIDVRKLMDNGGTEWGELDSQMFTNLKSGSPQAIQPVALPLGNYRAVQNETLQLRIAFTPNDATRRSGQGFSVNLKGVNCSVDRGTGGR